jgi:hypothetical protein
MSFVPFSDTNFPVHKLQTSTIHDGIELNESSGHIVLNKNFTEFPRTVLSCEKHGEVDEIKYADVLVTTWRTMLEHIDGDEKITKKMIQLVTKNKY